MFADEAPEFGIAMPAKSVAAVVPDRCLPVGCALGPDGPVYFKFSLRRILLCYDGGRWEAFRDSENRRTKLRFASPYLSHAIRTMNSWITRNASDVTLRWKAIAERSA